MIKNKVLDILDIKFDYYFLIYIKVYINFNVFYIIKLKRYNIF